jgi:C2H2-type zinc finger
MATRSSSAKASKDQFVCPECGREFSRASALGAHRKRSHGVAGTSRSATPRNSSRVRPIAQAAASSGTAARTKNRVVTRAAATPATAATRRRRSPSRSGSTRGRAAAQARRSANPTTTHDALLRALFPNGVPARASVIAALEPWLAEADRLARMR